MRKYACLLLCLVLIFPAARALAEDTEIILTFGGDTVLGTREEWKGRADNFDACIEQNGFAWPFMRLMDIFYADDLTLVNLECVLQPNSRGLVKNKQYRFRGDPSYTDILLFAGIESVNIANNHYIDYSASGRNSTREALAAGGIAYSGYEELYVFEKGGCRIGFAGCRETVFKQKKSVVKNDIQRLKEMGCDVIVYSFHWGKEYSPKHNSLQAAMAQYAADAGADIIVGTHPHCVQGIDILNGVPVLYSLGNLMFGGTHEMTTFDAFIARATLRFGEGGYEGVLIEPVPILTSGAAPDNNFQPVPAEGEDAERIIRLIQNDSAIPIEGGIWAPTQRGKP